MKAESADNRAQDVRTAPSPACVAPDTGQGDGVAVRGSTKRGPGRPKGSPKVPGSGRKRGTQNRTTVMTREQIRDHVDPFRVLADMALGHRRAAGDPDNERGKKCWVYPSVEQQLKAAEILAKKLLPDLKAVEVSQDPDNEPITVIREIIVEPKHAPSPELAELVDKLNGKAARAAAEAKPDGSVNGQADIVPAGDPAHDIRPDPVDKVRRLSTAEMPNHWRGRK